MNNKEVVKKFEFFEKIKKSMDENKAIVELVHENKLYVIKKIKDKTNLAEIYRAYATLARYLANNFEISELIADNLVKDENALKVLSELSMIATYSTKERHLKKVVLRYLQKKDASFLKEINAKIEAVIKAKQILDASPSNKTPEFLVDYLKRDLKQVSGIKIEILCGSDLKDWGLVQYVARGSKREPCVFIASYTPVKNKKPVVLAGKGVIFDAGGYNYKLRWIEDMKYDMAGGIATIYAVYAAARAGLNVNVVGAAVFVENLVSEDAYKPGDIIKSLSGKRVEVGNTDAEGRLILADLLWYLQEKYDASFFIDMATLTSASLIALGEEVSAVMSNDDALAYSLVSIGKEIEERCWQLPLWDEIYKDKIKSYFGDIKNIYNKPWGSTIIGAMFLKQFIKPGVKWAHIDITPAAFTGTPTWKGDAGATGYGIRLIFEFLKRGMQ